MPSNHFSHQRLISNDNAGTKFSLPIARNLHKISTRCAKSYFKSYGIEFYRYNKHTGCLF